MPLPRFVARFNRLVTNPLMSRLVDYPPFAGLAHRGRTSGAQYFIPINAFPCDDGFVFALTYGSETDWVRNVLAAEGGELSYGKESYRLSAPRIVGRDPVRACLPRVVRVLLALVRVEEFMLVTAEPHLDTP